jgi:2-dehydropantoate 2-reductase
VRDANSFHEKLYGIGPICLSVHFLEKQDRVEVAMKIAVMGAGAVGCYYGGMLAKAGHDVVLIGRPLHVEALGAGGLLLDTQTFTARVPLRASTEADAVRGAELVLFCVKSTDTENAAREMAPYLGSDARVLSLQNGVDNAQRLRALLRNEVASAVVYVAAEMAGPGHVVHHGRGELVIGPAVLSDQQAHFFVEAGVVVNVSENVAGALWSKLIVNCVYNALSAITQLPYGRLVQGVGVTAVMSDLVEECLAVAERDGVRVPGDLWATVQLIAQTMPAQTSSTAQDLARHKRSEIDHLNGYVIARGRALDIPTPVNRVMHTLVKLLESR